MVDKVIAIGIDHGWSHIKTRNSCFVSGVGELGGEPMVWDNILEYNGKYYRIGGERLKVQEDKVCNENYYLLTLAAIAKEFKCRGLKEAHIALAAGLPIGRFGAERKAFMNYLNKNHMVRFRYEKTQYTAVIDKVFIYPQCYGAVVEKLPSMTGQEYVVDIGSWTIDTLKIIDRAPDESSSGSVSVKSQSGTGAVFRASICSRAAFSAGPSGRYPFSVFVMPMVPPLWMIRIFFIALLSGLNSFRLFLINKFTTESAVLQSLSG